MSQVVKIGQFLLALVRALHFKCCNSRVYVQQSRSFRIGLLFLFAFPRNEPEEGSGPVFGEVNVQESRGL